MFGVGKKTLVVMAVIAVAVPILLKKFAPNLMAKIGA